MIRTLASTETPLFSQRSISAAASASMSRCRVWRGRREIRKLALRGRFLYGIDFDRQVTSKRQQASLRLTGGAGRVKRHQDRSPNIPRRPVTRGRAGRKRDFPFSCRKAQQGLKSPNKEGNTPFRPEPRLPTPTGDCWADGAETRFPLSSAHDGESVYARA